MANLIQYESTKGRITKGQRDFILWIKNWSRFSPKYDNLTYRLGDTLVSVGDRGDIKVSTAVRDQSTQS